MAKYIQHGEVDQEPYDPFHDAVMKAVQQESGEILLDGIRAAYAGPHRPGLIVDDKYWQAAIARRIEVIENLHRLSVRRRLEVGVEVGARLLQHIRTLPARFFAETCRAYLENKPRWQIMFASIGQSRGPSR